MGFWTAGKKKSDILSTAWIYQAMSLFRKFLSKLFGVVFKRNQNILFGDFPDTLKTW